MFFGAVHASMLHDYSMFITSVPLDFARENIQAERKTCVLHIPRLTNISSCFKSQILYMSCFRCVLSRDWLKTQVLAPTLKLFGYSPQKYYVTAF